MTGDGEAKLRIARRKMLRWITRVGRRPEEDWVSYIRRATSRCEALATEHAVSDWVIKQRELKWKLAGLTANRNDQRWSTRLLSWTPWFRVTPKRNVGRPCKRWEDDIMNYAGGSWTDAAKDKGLWQTLESGFIEQL
jgi:hypothetical protein